MLTSCWQLASVQIGIYCAEKKKKKHTWRLLFITVTDSLSFSCRTCQSWTASVDFSADIQCCWLFEKESGSAGAREGSPVVCQQRDSIEREQYPVANLPSYRLLGVKEVCLLLPNRITTPTVTWSYTKDCIGDEQSCRALSKYLQLWSAYSHKLTIVTTGFVCCYEHYYFFELQWQPHPPIYRTNIANPFSTTIPLTTLHPFHPSTSQNPTKCQTQPPPKQKLTKNSSTP